MFNIFKKEENEKDNNHPSIIAVACLLIHSAKIDENYTDKEKKIIKDAIIEMGACLLYTSPSPRDRNVSRMPSSA